MTGPLDMLSRHDTPTISNALNMLRGKTTAGYTRGRPIATDPGAAPVAGYAITMRIVTSETPRLSDAALRDIRYAHYRAVAAAPRPAIVVVQDIGAEPGAGALWGEVNVSVHRGLGVSGVLTDGAVRDLDALGTGLPILAGHIRVSSAQAHIVEIGVPVTVFGLDIAPGALVQMDRHGAQTIPPDLLPRLPEAVEALLAREREIIALTRDPAFDAEALIRAWEKLSAGH
ncbi:RraA family protein [Humitalea sp. 24SJ18S-53]|uniref:RraA family protein n=1 Tax=Humitalea sp. 24SJ18S-53 TaxID=3422307 RepID=UPI003D66D533